MIYLTSKVHSVKWMVETKENVLIGHKANLLGHRTSVVAEEEFPLLTNPSHTEFIYQNHDFSGAYKTEAYLEDSVFLIILWKE